VQGQAPVPDPDLARQRQVVDAFSAAADQGDFDALLAVLDPDIVLRSDGGPQRPEDSVVIRGARAVAERAVTFARLSPYARPALVNGAVGAVVAPDGRPFAVIGFTVTNGRIVEIDILSDPVRLSGLELSGLA
jgi:RNA polymerase sigma-70 factor (ECF subfamily)